jgi:hypothetical protein
MITLGEVLQPAYAKGVCRFIRHCLQMNELHILVLDSVTSQKSAFRRLKYIQLEIHMVFD